MEVSILHPHPEVHFRLASMFADSCSVHRQELCHMLHLRRKAEIQLFMSPSVNLHASQDASSGSDAGEAMRHQGERRGGVWKLVGYLRRRMSLDQDD